MPTGAKRDVIERVEVGGSLPGIVDWLDDSRARITCHGHRDPSAVYAAACHDGADLAALEVAATDRPSVYIVGPRDEVA